MSKLSFKDRRGIDPPTRQERIGIVFIAFVIQKGMVIIERMFRVL